MTDRKATKRANVQRYRQTVRRIDYIPLPHVKEIIEKHVAARLDPYLSGVIDKLIEAGDRAISGKP